ncbi:MAG TPA: hypothetical protein PKD32_04355 [Saprospiraceae bacterium]|nr:hypothetical protein [Saprospiraceae bacterium]
MKNFLVLISYFVLLSSCSHKVILTDLTEAKCDKLHFGKVEFRRLPSDEEKATLQKSGLVLQEYVFENYYLGVWNGSWTKKNLDKKVVKALYPLSEMDKLAGGLSMNELKLKAEKPGSSKVLIQTLGSLKQTELDAFGKMLFNKDNYYRLEVKNQSLLDLLDHSCVKLLNVMDEVPQADE